LQVAREAAQFGVALAVDFATGRVEANEKQRAVQMQQAIERLGPAYVKVSCEL
jgi:predicted unusual protein kinase regulating ubiquinone biosynthesis (AarF/ABC1/UbiB family)